jgi:hypothetical protein
VIAVSPRGGPRPGSGRKRLAADGALTRPVTVWLTPQQAARLRELGGGNASAGVRRLLAEREP